MGLILAVVAALLATVSVVSVAGLRSTGTPTLSASTLDSQISLCVGDEQRLQSCYLEFVSTHEKLPVRDLVTTFNRLHERNPSVTGACHDSMLAIGHLAWEKYRDLPKALSVGSEVCVGGFVHGVQEAVGADKSMSDDQVFSLLNNLCEGSPSDSYLVCFHGIGHAIWYRSAGGELKPDLCLPMSAFDESAGDVSMSKVGLCASGVAMLYFESKQMHDDVSTSSPDVFAQAKAGSVDKCASLVDARLRYGCLTYAAAFFPHNPSGYEMGASLCNTLAPEDAAPCFYSLARKIVYSPTPLPLDALAGYCNMAKDRGALEKCTKNVFLTLITVTNDLEAVRSYCTALPAGRSRIAPVCDSLLKDLSLNGSQNRDSIDYKN